MLLQRGPFGVIIQYLPFSLTTSTPFMVALSRPFPDGTNERSAKRQGRSVVTSTSSYSSPLRLLASPLPDLIRSVRGMGSYPLARACNVATAAAGRSSLRPTAGPSLLLRPHHQCSPVTYVTGDLAGGALPFHPEMRSDAARHEEGRNAAPFHGKIRLGRSIATTRCSSGMRFRIRSAGCEQ